MVLDPRSVLKANEDAETTTFDETIMTWVRAEIVRMVRENSTIRGIYRTINMPSPTYNLPYQDVRMTVDTVSELGDISAKKDVPEAKQKTQLVAKKLVAYSYISSEIIDDAVVDIVPFVISEAASELALAEENAFINGDTDGGTSDYLEMFNGIYHLTNDNGNNNVDLPQTPITLAAINKAMTNIHSSDYNLGDYVWLIHPKEIGTLRGMDEFEDASIFGESGSIAAGFQGKVYGIPVIAARTIPTDLGSGNDETFAVLCNRRYGYIGQRTPLRMYSFYQQTHDRLELQWNERIAFAIDAGHYDSHALITGIVA